MDSRLKCLRRFFCLHHCHPSTPLSPNYTAVTLHYNLLPGPSVSTDLSRPDPVAFRQHGLQTTVPRSPIYTAVTHLYHCHPSTPLSPIYTYVTHLHHCHPTLQSLSWSHSLHRPTVSTDPVTFGQHGLQTEVPQTFLPSTSLSPIYTTGTHLHRCHPAITVTHLHHCHPSIPLTHLHRCHPSITVSHLHICHPSTHLSPVYTTVTRLHHCHPSTHLHRCHPTL